MTTNSDGEKTYQWWTATSATATSGTAITGATGEEYILTTSEKGKYVGVTVKIAAGTNWNAPADSNDITDSTNNGSAKTYVTITYNKGTGVSAIGKTTENVTGSTTLPTITAIAGYTKDGWYNGNTKVGAEGESYTPTNNITLTASATANVYKINFYQGNGTSTAGNTKLGEMNATYGQKVKLTSYANLEGIFPYSKEDKNINGNTSYAWSFAGWCTSETGTSRDYTNGKEFTYNIDGDLNLYAVGSKAFSFSGGIAPLGIISSDTQYWNPYSTDLAYLTAINIPAKVDIDGWNFIGYKGGSSAATSSVTFASSIAGTSIKPEYNKYGNNRSVYERDITIAYNANGGTGTTTSTIEKQYYNSGYGNSAGTANNGANVSTPSFTLATNKFTRTGYNFSKWANSSTSETQYEAGTTYTGFTPAVDSSETTKTMYAIWSEKTATLTYNANGHGIAPSNVTMKYTTETNAASAITATNYRFDGWNTKADGTGTAYAAGAQVKAANVIPSSTTLYAQWTYNETPSINLTDYNTFSYDGTNSKAYYVSTSNTAPNAGTAQTSFELNKWTTAKNTGDLSLTAGQTYYVFIEDANATTGKVSINKASIAIRTITKSVGTGSGLTVKYTNSSGTNVTFSSNKANMLNGTIIYVSATASTGYKDPVLKKDNANATNSTTYTITANTTFASSVSPRTDTVYKVNHYVHDLGTNTYTLDSTENKTGTTDSEVTLANLKKTIAGFTYVDGFADTGNTTKPTSGAVTTTTIKPDGSRVINLYYRRNYLYVQYDMNGGTLSTTGNYGTSGSLITNGSTGTSTKFLRGVYGGKVGKVDLTTYDTDSSGLHNYNNPSAINVLKEEYLAQIDEEWNTKADGTGTSYGHAVGTYPANDFGGIDLSTGDKTVTVYVNWVKTNYGEYSGTTLKKYHATLADATSKAESGRTIKALVGVTETTAPSVPSGKSLVFDLNGKTTTLNGVYLTNEGTLDIYNSSSTEGILEGSGTYIVRNKGTFTTNNTSSTNKITLKGTSTAKGARVLLNDAGKTATLNTNTYLTYTQATTGDRYVVTTNGNLTIAGANITNKALSETVTWDRGVQNGNSNAKITITSGTIDTSGTAVIASQVTENDTANTAIEISGGTISSTSAPTIYNNHTKNIVTISGGDISSGSSYGALNNNTGTLNITGGNISSTSSNAVRNNSTGTTDITGGTITSTSGDAVLNNNTGTINITGGSITANAKAGINVTKGTVNITGGTITGYTYGVWQHGTNATTFTMGTDDSTIISSATAKPEVTATKASAGIGVHKGAGTFNFYDGVVKGASGKSIDATVSDTPDGYGVYKSTESNVETAILTKEYTATFYYYNGSAITSKTVTKESATDGKSTITIPTEVTGSSGKYGSSYGGLSTSTGNMTRTIAETATIVSINANTTYYAVYSIPVKIYTPTSASAVEEKTAYRNEYFASASAMTTKLGTSQTATSDAKVANLGIFGTLKGFATEVNTMEVSTNPDLSTLAKLRDSNVTTAYAIVTNNENATFYYNENTTSGSLTVKTATQAVTTTYYCNTKTTINVTHGTTETIPSAVSGSVGKYNSSYAGIADGTSKMSKVTTFSGGSKYYAVYSSPVTIYTPTSSSAVEEKTAHRNEYFTSTSAMATKLATSATRTTDATVANLGIYGALTGFTTAVNTMTVSTNPDLSTLAKLRNSDKTIVYAIVTDSVSATFYYYNGSAQATTTASGTRTIYCKSTSATAYSHGTISVPSAVRGSTGPKGEAYGGVASTTGSSTALTTANINTGTTKYYAFYNGDGTGETVTATFYYNSNTTSGEYTIATKTATGTQINNYTSTTNGTTYTSTKNSTTSNGNITIPTEVENSVGTYNNAYVGVATEVGTMSSNTSATTANTTYYAVYSTDVTVYRPSSIDTATTQAFHRNQWFTSTTEMSSTVLSTSATGKSNGKVTMVSGYSLYGFAITADTTTRTYNNVAAAASSEATTLYAVIRKGHTGTFWYNGSTEIGTFTPTSATATGYHYIRCATETTATTSYGNYTIPTAVKNSKGKYGSAYVGVKATINNMSSGTTASASNMTYYAVYRSKVTIYTPTSSSAVAEKTAYRNEYFTAEDGSTMATILATSTTGRTNATAANLGIFGTLKGFATDENTLTISTTPDLSTLAKLRNSNQTTVYAIVTNTRNITFNSGSPNNSTADTVVQTITYYYKAANTIGVSNGTITTPTPASISDWVALGWRDDTTIDVKEYDSATTITPSVTTYYAVYSRILTITYSANGGTGTVNDTTATLYLNTNSTTTSSQEVTLSDTTFTKTGYKFSQWTIGSTDYDKNTSYNPNLAYDAEVANWTITATAKWTVNTYTVRFSKNANDNEVNGTMADQPFEYDEFKALTNNAFTRTGYEFAGWSTSPDDTNIVFDNSEQSYDNTNGTSLVDMKKYEIPAPFASGDVYQLEVDAKGSGTLSNFFYGPSGYLQVASWTNSEGRSGTNTDGNNTIPISENYAHYSVRFTLGSTGDGNLNKYLLFRTQAGCNATIKNVRFYKVSQNSNAYLNGQSVKNLTETDGAIVPLYAIWKPTFYFVSEPYKYTNTLSEAVSAANAGTTITVMKNGITDTSDVTIDKNVKLNLNGKTLTKSQYNINITAGTTIIQGSGTIYRDDTLASDESGRIAFKLKSSGKISVQSAIVESNYCAIQAAPGSTGTINIDNSAMDSYLTSTIQSYGSGNITINNSSIVCDADNKFAIYVETKPIIVTIKGDSIVGNSNGLLSGVSQPGDISGIGYFPAVQMRAGSTLNVQDKSCIVSGFYGVWLVGAKLYVSGEASIFALKDYAIYGEGPGNTISVNTTKYVRSGGSYAVISTGQATSFNVTHGIFASTDNKFMTKNNGTEENAGTYKGDVTFKYISGFNATTGKAILKNMTIHECYTLTK